MVDININELVNYVNEKMKNGLSMTQIEKEMKVGKDTLRKKLNRNNFRYDKNLKKYVCVTNETQINMSTKYLTENSNNTNITQSVYQKDIREKNNSNKNNSNKNNKNELFTEEEITILKKIVKNHKLSTSDIVLDGEIVTRSVRTYKNVLIKFSKYCKDNKLSQKDSIATALKDFMEKY